MRAALSVARMMAALLVVWQLVPVTAEQNSPLKTLYDAHQWFRLRDAVQSGPASALYRGAIASAFNDLKAAEKHLTSVMAAAPQSEDAADARSWLIYASMRQGRYRHALSEVDRALAINPADAGLRNTRGLFARLSRHPDQSVSRRRSSTIHYQMKQGNLFVPVHINGRSAAAIFDTGANLSLVSEAEAARLGLPIDDVRAQLDDAAGAKVDVRTAVAGQLTIGDVGLRNVAFVVVNDQQQPFINLPLGERVVLGLPALLALETLRWTGMATSRSPSTRARAAVVGQISVSTVRN